MHLTAPVIYFAVTNSELYSGPIHTTEDLNTASATGHLRGFHISTVLAYMKKKKSG